MVILMKNSLICRQPVYSLGFAYSTTTGHLYDAMSKSKIDVNASVDR